MALSLVRIYPTYKQNRVGRLKFSRLGVSLRRGPRSKERTTSDGRSGPGARSTRRERGRRAAGLRPVRSPAHDRVEHALRDRAGNRVPFLAVLEPGLLEGQHGALGRLVVLAVHLAPVVAEKPQPVLHAGQPIDAR